MCPVSTSGRLHAFVVHEVLCNLCHHQYWNLILMCELCNFSVPNIQFHRSLEECYDASYGCIIFLLHGYINIVTDNTQKVPKYLLHDFGPVNQLDSSCVS